MNYFDEFKKSGNQSQHGLLLAVVLVALTVSALHRPRSTRLSSPPTSVNKRCKTRH